MDGSEEQGKCSEFRLNYDRTEHDLLILLMG